MKKTSNNLRNINLNLLPILAELLARRNVTDTAKSLNITQSAVSSSLKRLRDMFDDELLIPYGRGLALTDKAQKLQPGLNGIISSIHEFLGDPSFDPQMADHVFRIITADYVTTLLGPHLGKILDQAPNIRFRVAAETSFADRHLRMGEIDLVIAPERIWRWTPLDFNDPNSDFIGEQCFLDRLIGIQPTGGTEAPTDLDAYLAHPHVSFCLRDGLHASLEQETLDGLGLTQNNMMVIPEFSLLPPLAIENDAISVIPSSLAKRYARIYPITTFTPPIEFPEVKLVMIWTKSRSRDPALTWFRTQLHDIFARVQE